MPAPGDRLGRFVVEGRIGHGGMAEVWRVRDDRGATFALKLLTLDRADVRERFKVEAEIQRRLDHPNIVRAVEVLDVHGELGLVMEYVPGRALDAWLVGQRLAPREALDRIARQVIGAVGYAHGLGLVHRDLKPGNVLVVDNPEGPVAKITDFGLAKQLDRGHAATRSGIALGTPRYMAPEQIRDAKRVDGRADIWSLGALLFELYTGRPAFHRDALVDIFGAVLGGVYDDPATLGVAGPVRDAIVGALRVDPARRFQDCRAMLVALFPPEFEPPPVPVLSPRLRLPAAPTLAPVTPPPDTPLPDARVPERPATAPSPPRRRAKPRHGLTPWIAAWLAALVGVVLAFAIGMSVIGVVWVAG